jgi:hypothetical protein
MPPQRKHNKDLKLVCEVIPEDRWQITGKKTYDYRTQMRQAGGVWDKQRQAWIFKTNPESLTESLNSQTEADEAKKHTERQQRGREAAASKQMAKEYAERRAVEKAAYDFQMTDPELRSQVDEMSRQFFATKPMGSFWPIDQESPFCILCHYHIPWLLYQKHDKDVNKAAAAYHMECPQCLHDFTR